jgi:hypothetical protein
VRIQEQGASIQDSGAGKLTPTASESCKKLFKADYFDLTMERATVARGLYLSIGENPIR